MNGFATWIRRQRIANLRRMEQKARARAARFRLRAAAAEVAADWAGTKASELHAAAFQRWLAIHAKARG